MMQGIYSMTVVSFQSDYITPPCSGVLTPEIVLEGVKMYIVPIIFIRKRLKHPDIVLTLSMLFFRL